nr:uncharacterized protein LOC107436914 [Parasteatoda tepidariorum]
MEKQNEKELGDSLALLKRKRRTVRGNVTRFITKLNSDLSATSDTLNENVEYISHRLSDCLLEMKKLDNDNHSLLTDGDYDNDIIQCEEYMDNAELAIFKAKKFCSRNNFESNTSRSPEVTVSQIPVTQVPVMQLPVSQSHTVKLPTIKLDTFRGDIEQWQCLWEQFKSSIDDNNSLSLADKHVFLRGYLEDEPRRLVDGISISADTYETTKALLQNRYGDKNRMIQAHLDFLENISPIRNPTPIVLNEVFIECNRRRNALTALGEDINAYGRVLAPKILRAFPDDIWRRWIIYAKREKISEGDMNKLVQYLSEEVEGALTTLKIRGEQNFDYIFKTSTAALHVNSKKIYQTKKPSPFCPFCEINGHWPQDCTNITDIDTRIQKLKTSGRCFLCTNRGHSIKNCLRKDKAFCIRCKKKHHVSICKNNSSNQPSHSISTNNIDTRTPNFTHLQTARVYITGPTGITKLTRCILDCGSQTSFIHSHLVDYLKLDVISSDSLEIHAFESSSNQAQSRRKVRFKLSSIWNQSEIYLHAFESPNRYAVHPSVPLEIASTAHKKIIRLADPNDTMQERPIEVLIGADFYWTVVNSEIPFRLSETIVLIPSVFGWILSGSRSHTSVASLSSVHNISIKLPYTLDDQVRKFWDLDTLGIKVMQDREMSIRSSEILEDFCSSYEVLENRRVVRLPWKKEFTLSSNNYHGDPNRWKTFVCNRTNEILNYTNPTQWRHCSGNENPADHLSRGVVPTELKSLDLWWLGPTWLTQSSKFWPSKQLSDANPDVYAELRKPASQSLLITSYQPLIDISRFSSYMKLLRFTASIFRFLYNCRSKQRNSIDLTCDELNTAKNYWILTVKQQCFSAELNALQNNSPLPKSSKISRFNPFLRENLIRLGGRLQFASFKNEQKHPLLLDGSHPFVHLFIYYTHVKLHHLGVQIVLSEIRSSFWIIRGCEAIKRVLDKCLPCKLSQASRSQQLEAPLPRDRITPWLPFTTIGIDFTGPLYVRNLKSLNTAYIALFTCSTTRAVHIELVSDLTTDKFLMALKRFVGRRGLPLTIYTDNATTFHAANKELSILCSQKFSNIMPRRELSGNLLLHERLGGEDDEEGLSTALVGVEAALNSRPLVYEQGNDDPEETLTPSHFLTGKRLTTIPSQPAASNLSKVRNIQKSSHVRVGDIVLLHEDVRPRHTWKRALVTGLIKGRDGKVRTCTLRSDGKEISRPVQLIIPLEVDQGGEDVPDASA